MRKLARVFNQHDFSDFITNKWTYSHLQAAQLHSSGEVRVKRPAQRVLQWTLLRKQRLLLLLLIHLPPSHEFPSRWVNLNLLVTCLSKKKPIIFSFLRKEEMTTQSELLWLWEWIYWGTFTHTHTHTHTKSGYGSNLIERFRKWQKLHNKKNKCYSATDLAKQLMLYSAHTVFYRSNKWGFYCPTYCITAII